MNLEKLRKHAASYVAKVANPTPAFSETRADRKQREIYYRSWTAHRIRSMTREDLVEYLSKLWAMLIWGNKEYVVDKLISDHGLENLLEAIANLIWGESQIQERWDDFRSGIKGMGPAMMSELLCHVHPASFIIWNRRALTGMEYLEISGLPHYNYQVNGSKYAELCGIGAGLAKELKLAGAVESTLLDVDYFIWEELQIEVVGQSSAAAPVPKALPIDVEKADPATAAFIHDEVKEKLAEIGQWLGFSTKTEIKVADGSVVDTVWESTIGNMGRVIYVFEVQTKGSVDSLLMNLLKALNNPAVQGIVAVSDLQQLEKIKKHAAGVAALRDKLRYWDYLSVLSTHESLEKVNESINKLGLVPQGLVG